MARLFFSVKRKSSVPSSPWGNVIGDNIEFALQPVIRMAA